MDAQALIATIRREVEDAAQAMISAATRGLRLVGEARDGRVAALDDLEETLCAILEACAFQDLTGQRLTRLSTGELHVVEAESTLLEGPQAAGAGLDQSAADALFADAAKAR